MDQHQVGPVERRVEIELGKVIAGAGELGERTGELPDRRLPVLVDELAAAPGVPRFEHPHVVSAGLQLGDDASEEVRVAVVPV